MPVGPDLSGITDAVMRALPGWCFVCGPEPFTSAPNMHFRARLAKGNVTQRMVIRRAWRNEAYEVETFVYRSVLPHLSIRTPRLWATFVLDTDGSNWMVLEDIGTATARGDRVEHRRAMLRALGTLHGEGMHFLSDKRHFTGPLPRFRPGFVPYGGRFVPVQKWLELLKAASLWSAYRLEAWVAPFLDALLRQLLKEPMTLLHGDANFSNAVLIDDGIGLVDFERACIGPPSLDLSQVASMTESLEELDDYRWGFVTTRRKELSMDTVVDWAELGEVYNCFYWICYYIEETICGRSFGKDMRRHLYDRSYERLRELHQQHL